MLLLTFSLLAISKITRNIERYMDKLRLEYIVCTRIIYQINPIYRPDFIFMTLSSKLSLERARFLSLLR